MEFFQQLHGKELSYNNILDLTAAAALINEFTEDAPTVAILKHQPCGVGQGTTLREAWDKGLPATDKQARLAASSRVNRPLDAGCAEAIAEIFSEVIVAGFHRRGAGDFAEEKKSAPAQDAEKLECLHSRGTRSVGADSFLMQQRDLKSRAPQI